MINLAAATLSDWQRWVEARPLARLAPGLGVLVAAVAVHITSLGQKLLELHSFRQTQTAWTALIFHQQGIDLFHPKVPVFGPPFDLPFEFPLFQALASLVMDIGVAPDLAMRLTGLATFVLAAAVLWRLVTRLAGEVAGLVALAALVFSGLGLLWSRSSMIEYLVAAAALAMLYFALRWHDSPRWGWYVLALAAGILALLIKPTTAVLYLPALVALGLAGLRSSERRPLPSAVRYATAMLALIAVPLLYGYMWTAYADAIKAASPFTADQTSAALTSWNYGTIAQRLSPGTWELIGGRIDELVLGGATVIWVVLAFVGCLRLKRRAFAVAWLAGAFIGPLLFTNLYWIHDYYLIALSPMAAAGVGLAVVWMVRKWRWVLPPLVAGVLILAWGMTLQRSEHYWGIQWWNTAGGELHFEAAQYIDARSNPTDLVVVTGRGWNPATLYYAQRWGLMVTGGVEESLSRALGPDLLPELRATGYTRLFHCPTNEKCSAAYDLTVDPPRRLP